MALTNSYTVDNLEEELKSLEGLHGQNPENGAGSGSSYLRHYTNRVFGMPYQLMDNVDKRFPTINRYLGNEYLKNFALNSAILHIKPGMPKYTGGSSQTDLSTSIKSMYMGQTVGGSSFASDLFGTLAQNTIFSSGSKLQRRMFGFRETYYDYMQHVNYMCRSAAIFMKLTSSSKYPSGTFTSNNTFENFKSIDWSNYRMLGNSEPDNPMQYFKKMLSDTGDNINGVMTAINNIGYKAVMGMMGGGTIGLLSESLTGDNLVKSLQSTLQITNEDVKTAWEKASSSSLADTLVNKTSSVEFMVDPIDYTETLTNTTRNSVIEDQADAIRSSIGSEIQFITGSNADLGALGDVLNVLGDGASSAVTQISSLANNVTGGFLQNVFSGAIQSIKGQKMLYPKIYDSSNSETNYSFSITLESPYGDAYNYYMNIVVPLCHLIALAAPRMVTSNTTTSPFLIQAYIPGMVTCQMGIINSMSIVKNPNGTHVSVDGFPLSVKVNITIEELYNAMAISPANDPASFMFNETLNDYLANLAGLIPSVDTYTQQRQNAFSNMYNYFGSGEWKNDIVSGFNEKIENLINPFY